jgi:mono/diheme cytochrome c family protein
MVDFRLKIMRDGLIGSVFKALNPDYTPKIAKLLVLARGKIRNELYVSDIDYEKDLDRLQAPPPVDAVFFACSGCHHGRVIVGGEMDDAGNIVKAGRMKFLPGMPNTEIEAQYFSKLLMLSGVALIESGFSADATSLPASPDDVVPSKAAILALYTRMLTRAIDPELVKTIYGPSPEQVKRAKLQTYWVAKDFPTYIGTLIGIAIKTQYIYYQIAAKYAFNPDNPNKHTPEQKVPDVIGDRIGQMDAFGVASDLVAIHTLRKDNSYMKFMQQDNPDNPLLAGIDTVPGFSGRVGPEEAGKRIRDNLQYWVPQVPAPIDIKSLNWSGHRELANWDGNQGASARAIASGTSATGDPLKVNVRIHEPLNPLINNMPPPPYPFDIDKDKARRGMEIFNGLGLDRKKKCAGCHQPNKDWVFAVSKIGVDENRSKVTSDVSRYGLATLVMEACNIFMRKNPGNDWCLPRDKQGNVITDWELSTDDYFKDTPGRVRAGKNGYKVDMLHGIWARAPYLHNGSVPTLMHMLCPDTRPTVFNRGVLFYDQEMVGFEWQVTPQQRYSPYDVQQVKQYNTRDFGRANSGHRYGSSLCPDTSDLDPIRDREEITIRIIASEIDNVLEYLKTL